MLLSAALAFCSRSVSHGCFASVCESRLFFASPTYIRLRATPLKRTLIIEGTLTLREDYVLIGAHACSRPVGFLRNRSRPTEDGAVPTSQFLSDAGCWLRCALDVLTVYVVSQAGELIAVSNNMEWSCLASWLFPALCSIFYMNKRCKW